MERISSKLYA